MELIPLWENISKTRFKDSPFHNQHTTSSSRNRQLYFKPSETGCCGHTHIEKLSKKKFFSGSNKNMDIKTERYLMLFAYYTKQTTKI